MNEDLILEKVDGLIKSSDESRKINTNEHDDIKRRQDLTNGNVSSNLQRITDAILKMKGLENSVDNKLEAAEKQVIWWKTTLKWTFQISAGIILTFIGVILGVAIAGGNAG